MNFRCVVLLACFGMMAPYAPAQVTSLPQPLPSQSRLGMNLAGPSDWNTELPFADLFHLSRAWISQKKGVGWGQGPALSLDEHGWIKSLESDCFAETPLLTDMKGQFPHGQYICLYEGKGDISIQNAGKIVSSEPGRIVFEPQERDGFFVRISAVDPTNIIRSIRVLLPGTENTYKTNPFNPVFSERWKGFNTLRFMDWMQTNGSQVKKWDESPQMSDATWTAKGIPLEIMIDLCNRQKQNGWFCIPAHASDDYVRRFATQLRERLNPNLKAYIEYSNEVWNGGFEQNHYAGEQGKALGLGDKPWEAAWHFTAHHSKEIFAIFDAVYGGRSNASKQIVRVLATQAVNPYVSEQILDFEEAGKSADALATAPYFGLITPPQAIDPNAKAPAEKVEHMTVPMVLDLLEQNSLPEALESIQKQKAIADKYGLKLVAYEGGQHAVGIAGAENNDKITALFLAANRDERMGQLYTRYLDGWKQNGGDLFCNFSSIGMWSKWGSWGLLESQTDDTPKYRAVISWNKNNLRN